MALNKYKLGDLIRICDERNYEEKYILSDVKGISTQKSFIETKADMLDVSLKNYKIVKSYTFVYVADTSRRGDKISLAYNNTNDTYLVSSISTVFKVNRNDLLDSDYLYMYFNRPEFDRYARFNSWGSARETFSWQDMCDIEIELPSIDIQKKYVAIYKAMLENQKCYECGLEDLKLVCDAYVERLRKSKKDIIGEHIIEYNEKNEDEVAKKEMGVSINKVFFPTKSSAADISNQKIAYPETFAFNTNTSRNSETLSIALNKSKDVYAVSPTYCVFKTDNQLIPDYLLMWFKREEFNRYARFNSWGSARETISLEEIKNTIISIPDLTTQQSIVNIYNAYVSRKQTSEKLKAQIKNICPILIKGSIEEATKTKEG